MSNVTLLHGDCLDLLPTLEAGSVDSIVCDPPYGLSFMGKGWDYGVPGVPFWEAALRVAKPGAMLLAFGGTRTHHRLTCAIEDAGWEIRDCLMWLYGQGFPKSHNISAAIDKAAGAEREVVHARRFGGRNGESATAGASNGGTQGGCNFKDERSLTAPATDAAHQWDGWGTALKPAHEIIVRAIKPFPDQTERDIIVGNLCQKEAQLWLLLHVSIAGRSSMLSQAELDEVLSIAQWSAEKLTSTQGALCGQMDTSQFASMVSTCLNIVTSWKSMLADLWKLGNTSTISTASSLTIDSKTLSYLLLQTTLEGIIQAEMQAPGSQLNALPAAKFLNAVEANITSTRMLSALGNATYRERTKRLDATADLSPAWEPIIMAMKPLDGTFANNALVHGVAGINVDGCRIDAHPHDANRRNNASVDRQAWRDNGPSTGYGYRQDMRKPTLQQGRWPANLILDEEAAAMLDEASGALVARNGGNTGATPGYDGGWNKHATDIYRDTGGASRFFYCAKASKRDRDEGLEGMELRPSYMVENGSKTSGLNGERYDRQTMARNHHPTVKPTSLMRWLVRLVTPPGGVVLDQFMGSGSTGKAAVLEGFNFIGIDREAEYLEIAKRRIEAAKMPFPYGTSLEIA